MLCPANYSEKPPMASKADIVSVLVIELNDVAHMILLHMFKVLDNALEGLIAMLASKVKDGYFIEHHLA